MMIFPVDKAVKVIFNNIIGEGILDPSDPAFDYYLNKVLKKGYRFGEFFRSIEGRGYTHFYPGTLYAKDEWLYNIRIDDEDLVFYVSGYEDF